MENKIGTIMKSESSILRKVETWRIVSLDKKQTGESISEQTPVGANDLRGFFRAEAIGLIRVHSFPTQIWLSSGGYPGVRWSFCKGISNISMKETAAGSVFLGEHGKAGDVMRRSG